MRFSLSAVLLCSSLSLLAACGPDPDALLTRARAESAAADDRAARLDLLEVLKARPDDAGALRLMAQTQIRLGDGEGALATLDKLAPAARRDPGLIRLRAEAELLRGRLDASLATLGQDPAPGAWRIRAAVALARQDSAGALSAFQAGVRAGRDPALLIDYARFLMSGEDYSGAARALAEARRAAGNTFAVLLLEGDLHAQQQQTGPAEQAYVAAAALAPRRVEPLLGRAALADAAGQLDAEALLVAEAGKLDPDNPRVGQWLVQVAQMKGDWQTVRDRLAPREASLDPRSPEGLAYAEALLNLGQPEQARAIFGRVLSLSPQNPYARMMLAEAQLATGDARVALDTIRPLADAPTADQRVLEIAERAAKASGDPAAATFAQRQAATAESDSRKLAANGQAAYARGDWNAALAAYTALNARGEDPDVLRRLALSASRAGQHDLAIASADRALALQADNPDMLFAAGLARYNAGRDPERARALLKAALVADPDNALFRTAEAQVRAAGPKT